MMMLICLLVSPFKWIMTKGPLLVSSILLSHARSSQSEIILIFCITKFSAVN